MKFNKDDMIIRIKEHCWDTLPSSIYCGITDLDESLFYSIHVWNIKYSFYKK